MKNKLLRIVSLSICAALCALGFVACGEPSARPPEVPATFTVTFETNGGSPIPSVTSDKPVSLEELLDGKTTEKEDLVFDGWHSDKALLNKVGLKFVADKDMTFYAKWRDYTDAELLTNAVQNTRKTAVAAHDTGAVRFSSSNYNVVDVTLTLDNGSITSGAREASGRYYKDGAFYYTDADSEKTKLQEKQPDTAAEFLYTRIANTVNYNVKGFYSVFAPLAMYKTIGASQCSFVRDGDTFTITYLRNDSGIKLNWSAENDPWVYFDAGKIFKFTVANKRIAKVEQIAISEPYRTIEFFYDGDENIPQVPKPQDESAYVQKWQLRVDGSNVMVTELNKSEMDKAIYGDSFKQITDKQTYYYDKEMRNEVPFDANGIAPITEHTELYHAEVRMEDLVVDGFTFTGNRDLLREGASVENGVKVTTFRRLDNNALGTYYISVSATPSAATAENKEFTVELVDKQDGENIEVQDFVGSKEVTVSKAITREITIKVTALKGGHTEYIRVKPCSTTDSE